MERSLRTVGTGRGSGSVRLIARTQCDDLSLLNRVCGAALKPDVRKTSGKIQRVNDTWCLSNELILYGLYEGSLTAKV
jgi:hypothetical protein